MKEKKSRSALSFIFVTMLIDITGLGLIIPVMPKLIEEIMHVPANSASKYGGWLIAAYAVTQFIFAPLVGNLSDKYGRRPVILISLVGFAIDYMFLFFSTSLSMLFIGRIIAGITGSSFTSASAYIADVSEPKDRAKNFGLIGVAFGIGFIVGPLMGGLLGSFGPRVPFLASAILCAVNFIYGYFYLPESLPKERRRNFDWKRANPIGSFMKLRKYPEIIGLIFALVLTQLASHAVQSNWSFFTMYRFGWKEGMVGISLSVAGLLTGLVQGGLIRIVNPIFGEKKSVYIGLAFYALGMVLFSFANQGWMMFVFLVPYCLGGIAGPALQSIITSKVPSNEQGELQGIIASMMSATSIIGPPMMTNTFYFFSQKGGTNPYFPGAPFLLAAVLMAASAFLAHYTLTKGRLVDHL